MNVYFTHQTTVPLNPWEQEFLPAIRTHFAGRPESRYRLVDKPADAELIVLLESNNFRTQRDIAALLNEPVVRDYPDQTFTVNYEDYPAGFLPGLYAALPSSRFDPGRHRSWCYLFPPNPQVYRLEPRPVDESCDLLFSFRGAESYPLRRQLFEMKLTPMMRGRITKVDRWFNHNPQEQQEYVDEIRRSRFVLCPRGLAAASHRLFEVMAQGRCPVIIGDEWVPPQEVDWAQCSIRIAECDLKNFPDILHAREPEAAQLGQGARRAWEEFFSPGRKFEATLNAMILLRDSRPASYNESIYQRLWHSRGFQRNNGWTMRQRLDRKVKKLWRKVRWQKPTA